MSKAHGLPISRCVAGLALRALGSFVDVIFGVTTDASSRRALELIIAVARGAGRVSVGAGQRELRLAVVEVNIGPFDFAVAIDARLAQRTLVAINVAMTGDTCRWRAAIFSVRRMA